MGSDLIKSIQELDSEFVSALNGAENDSALEQVRIDYLGRKGKLSELFNKRTAGRK